MVVSEDASLLEMPLSGVVVIAKNCKMFKNSLGVAGQVKLSSGTTGDLGAMYVIVVLLCQLYAVPNLLCH